MTARPVLVVGETPSLGRSIVDLLEAGDLTTRFVLDLDTEGPVATIGGRFAVVVVASTGYFCATARRWIRGEIPGAALVVVASHDPALKSGGGLHAIDLPLAPDRVLRVVRELVERSPRPNDVPSG